MDNYTLAEQENVRLSSVSKITALLNKSIETYAAELYQTPTAKDNDLALGMFARLSPDILTAVLWQLSRVERSVLGMFSFAKHALTLSIQTDSLADLSTIIPQLLHTCVEAGAFKNCIDFTDIIKDSGVWNIHITPKDRLLILLMRAKSLRNRGKYQHAEMCYREAIEMAENLGEQAEVAIGLLLLGKLYGNYLGQRSLFAYFVEVAKERLEYELDKNKAAYSELDNMRMKRCVAICHDSLGQVYRESVEMRSKARNHFLKAFYLNREMGRRDGMSRALCHLSHFNFGNATSENERLKCLAEFKDGMDLLQIKPRDERGMGIRFIQYASMLQKVDDYDTAKQYIAYGKLFATRYSEYKTLTRAAITEYEIYKNSNIDKAIDKLKEGRAIACEYNLLIPETEINRRLATLSSYSRNHADTNPIELLNRNRNIFVSLISQVKARFEQLGKATDFKPRSNLPSTDNIQAFRELSSTVGSEAWNSRDLKSRPH